MQDDQVSERTLIVAQAMENLRSVKQKIAQENPKSLLKAQIVVSTLPQDQDSFLPKTLTDEENLGLSEKNRLTIMKYLQIRKDTSKVH